MIGFPNCKINLALRVLDRRPDGFHNIESVFYPAKWCDAVEVIASEKFSFETFGNSASGNIEDNLCVKAFELLQKKFNLPFVKLCLLKNIPIGAGLGGGSSDAAFTLKLINEFFLLKISDDDLKTFAAEIGSDCSFFIEGNPCFVSERGDRSQQI
ncbi:MAG: 4-(cytidine 5'-diphospho)-2-C-methyl-D-erythritol kinase, partial [Chitinophagales bacterium]